MNEPSVRLIDRKTYTDLAPFMRAIVIFAISGPLFGQVITPAPKNFLLDGNISEWDRGIHKLDDHYGEAPWGIGIRVLLGQNKQGLVVAGRVDQSFTPALAATDAELDTQSRVELRLSAADHLTMPGVSWRSNDREDESPESCALGVEDTEARHKCVEWISTQKEYRAKLRQLFSECGALRQRGLRRHMRPLYSHR